MEEASGNMQANGKGGERRNTMKRIGSKSKKWDEKRKGSSPTHAMCRTFEELRNCGSRRKEGLFETLFKIDPASLSGGESLKFDIFILFTWDM